jgi:glycosyltransferase involved in cell wall biosynthesis
MKRIAIITCYKDPDYIRARALRQAVRELAGYELVVVKNTRKGLLRYIEVPLRLIWVRLRLRPDVYILTFRGYEMLLFARLITAGKPLVYDEFINLVEWVVYEHKKVSPRSLAAWVIYHFYRALLFLPARIMTDTASHADYSAKLMKISRKKFAPIAVGTDEVTFRMSGSKNKATNDKFVVFYYGSMLPLHGVPVVLDAMKELAGVPSIKLVLIGGKEAVARDVATAQKAGANIEYLSWVDFNELPKYIDAADVCLGGPFGGTLQAEFVITGKTYQFLSMGKPTVVGENNETSIFSNKKDSIVVEQGSPKKLADAIRWAYEHRDELPKIGEKGEKLYRTKLSNEVVAHQLKGLLSELVGTET